MDKIISHRQAVKKIAEDLNLSKEKVEGIVGLLFNNLEYHLDGTNVIKLPYIGALVPDMRAHRHLKKREKRVAWMAYNRRNAKNQKVKKEKLEAGLIKPKKKKKSYPKNRKSRKR